MAKIAWGQQNFNTHCNKYRAADLYYHFPNTVLIELWGRVCTKQKSIYESWQYYKNFWKLSQPPTSFKYFEADYQQSVEYHLSISLLLLLNHTGLPLWLLLFDGSMPCLVCSGRSVWAHWFQIGESTLFSFYKHLFSIKESTPTPSKSLYQKVSKTSFSFLQVRSYAHTEIVIESFIQKNHISSEFL